MGNLHHNIQLMLKFLKGLFFVLHFSSYTLMAFLMMLPVIFLCADDSTLNMIRHLICGNNYNWVLNLNLIYEIVWAGARSGLLMSMLEKLN